MPDSVDTIRKAVNSLNLHRKIQDNATLQSLSPRRMPLIDKSSISSVKSELEKTRSEDWRTALTHLVKSAEKHQANDEIKEFEELAQYVKILTRIASAEPLWATKLMCQNCGELSGLSIEIGTKESLELAAGTIRQAFRVTVSDYENEEPLEGRTTKCYDIAVFLLRIYTRLHAYPLAEGILSAVQQYSRNIPPLTRSPPRTQVQFLFYKALFKFYSRNYNEASELLESALSTAEDLTTTQLERIMVFHIPATYLASNKVPTASLWERLPRLKEIYFPLIQACRFGDSRRYHEHLQKHGNFLRANRLYLACDSMFPRLKLNLLRRTWVTLGKPKRLPLKAYSQALQTANLVPHKIPQLYAAEYYVSQFILNGEVKGYIHHEMRLLMLSKSRPFPTLMKTGASDIQLE